MKSLDDKYAPKSQSVQMGTESQEMPEITSSRGKQMLSFNSYDEEATF